MASRHRNHKRKDSNSNLDESNAWVLTTKRVGDPVAGWVVERLYDKNIRQLNESERCAVTAFCYPTGAKVVRAKLQRVSA